MKNGKPSNGKANGKLPIDEVPGWMRERLGTAARAIFPKGMDPDAELLIDSFHHLESELTALSEQLARVQEENGKLREALQNGPHHDSRSYRDRDIVTAPEAVPLFGFKRPAPLRWYVAGLIPEGHVSILSSDGGNGKSFLAIDLALCICLGLPFLGLKVRRGRVLYVDYELDADEQRRRVWRVAEGMGVSVDDERLKGRFFYYRPTAPLGTDQAHDEVMHLIEKHDIDFVVLDSLTVGSAGADVTASDDVVPMMQRLREWGTVLAIDHISSSAARGNQSQATPFGSVFKRNLARSTLTLSKADGGGLLLKPDKANFTAKQDLVCFAIEFDGQDGPVCFEKIRQTDNRMAGSLKNMSTHDVTLTAVEKLYEETGQPVTPGQIATWRGDHDASHIEVGTAQNHLTVLKQRGKVERVDGGAVPTGAGYALPSDHGLQEGQVVETPKGKGVFKEASNGRFFVQMTGDPNDVRGFEPEEIEPSEEAPF